MQYVDLKGKSADELKQLILENRKELFNLRFQRTTGELEKTHRFNEIRKDIARIQTFMNSGAQISTDAAPKAAKGEKKAKAAKEKKEKVAKEKAAKKETKKKKVA